MSEPALETGIPNAILVRSSDASPFKSATSVITLYGGSCQSRPRIISRAGLVASILRKSVTRAEEFVVVLVVTLAWLWPILSLRSKRLYDLKLPDNLLMLASLCRPAQFSEGR